MLRQREVAAMELAVHSSKNITVALNMNRAKVQHHRACWFYSAHHQASLTTTL